MKNFLLGCAALAIATAPAPAIAQQVTVQKSQMAAPVVEKIEVNQDGSLTGKVYAKVASEETPVDAKVTLAKEGVVIEAVQTENGSFAFANIAPGSYTLYGATTGFAGAQNYEVVPYAGVGCSSCSLGLQGTDQLVNQGSPVYQNSPVYNMPVSASTTYQSSGIVSSGGGGGGVSSGGFGGGRLLGRRVGRRGLLRAGLIGGVVAIAVDDDDDVSAAE